MSRTMRGAAACRIAGIAAETKRFVMRNGIRIVMALFAVAALTCTATAFRPVGGDRAAAELAARCDSLVRGVAGEVIAVAVDDGRERVLYGAEQGDYAVLFEELLGREAAVECDCRDDYDARICYAVLCCRAYRNGCVISQIVMPLNEDDATKGDMVYPLERRITDPLLRLIAF